LAQPETQAAFMRQPETQAAPVSQTGPQTGTQNASHARMQAGTQNESHAGNHQPSTQSGNHQAATMSHPTQQKGAKRGRKRSSKWHTRNTTICQPMNCCLDFFNCYVNIAILLLMSSYWGIWSFEVLFK